MYCLPETLPLFRKSCQSLQNYDWKRRENFWEVRPDRKSHAVTNEKVHFYVQKTLQIHHYFLGKICNYAKNNVLLERFT